MGARGGGTQVPGAAALDWGWMVWYAMRCAAMRYDAMRFSWNKVDWCGLVVVESSMESRRVKVGGARGEEV